MSTTVRWIVIILAALAVVALIAYAAGDGQRQAEALMRAGNRWG